MSSGFQTAGQTFKELDPFQRVKYSAGLMMGVDEFEQEQAYFRGRGHLHQRGLHGYGTVSGLQVAVDGTQVIVTPGLAIDPFGRPIRIRAEQAGDVADWLAGNDQGTGTADADGCRSLYVLLAYAETERGRVRIPGPTERAEQQALAFSRVDEVFELRFSPVPPLQQDEEAARRFGHLLNRLRPVIAGEGISPDTMAEQVRSLLSPSRAGADAHIPVRPERAEQVLQTAVRVWVTEVRPAVVAVDSPESAAVLLARVDFSMDPDGAVHSLAVVEEGRPFLLPTQVLQQYLLLHAGRGRDGAPGGGAHLPPPAPGPAAHSTLPVQPFVTITRSGGAATPTVELWFHLPADVAAMPDPFALAVFAEPITAMGGADRPAMRMPVAVLDMQPTGPNRLVAILDPTAARHPHLRFEFHLHGGNRKGGRGLQRLMAESGVSWIGYDGDATVVAFHHYQPVSEVVAAGVVEKGRVIRGNLDVAEQAPGVYLLTFPAFEQNEFYMVKGSPIIGAADYQRTFEVVREHDLPGIVVRVPGSDSGFMVEISRIV